ncbi:hypothetical protein PPYR_07749 [Photinus pyralis]|uniref:Serpin domain-containing protein n=1 Tax=Photinus pyralis TaxID=7054 RepID=A0A1Y1KRG8_PHOPY|nr:serine protease inhibitor 28Dc-like [Photinus pyralis]KAB0799869.1 hypothetical protein PPYR_07749 [Photinus pyralis]
MNIGLALALSATIALVTSQIYFPTEELDQIFESATKKNQPLRPSSDHDATDPDSTVSNAIAKLTLDINRATGKLPNLAFSPYNIAGVLAPILLGSIGQTSDEISNLLGFDERFRLKNDNLEIHRQLRRFSQKIGLITGFGDTIVYKSVIFVQEDYPIRKEYELAANYFYQTKVLKVDFQRNPAAAQTFINTWVANNTFGIIPTLLESTPRPSTKAVIAGTLYFKGAWDKPFLKGGSTWRPFYTNGRTSRSTSKVMMMYNGGEFPYYKSKDLQVEILGLPYKGGNTMYVILPQDSNINKLRYLENYLTPVQLLALVNATKPTEVVVAFPKMQVSATLHLAQTLRNLGARSLFDPNTSNLALITPGFTTRFGGVYQPRRTTTQSPPNWNNQLIFARFNDQTSCQRVYDFITRKYRCYSEVRRPRAAQSQFPQTSPLDFLDRLKEDHRQLSANPQQANPGLYAEEFIHKTFIDITEEGTEAVAASGIGINRSGGQVTFRCDVPFLFFIYQKETKMILFWGSVTSPEPSAPSDSK